MSAAATRRAPLRLPLPANPAVRWIGGAVLVVILLNLLVAGVASYTRQPSGPPSSSYATSPKGVAAWAALLDRAGHPTGQLRVLPGDASLDEESTVVMLDPQTVTSADELVLEEFVDRGGRLVAGETSSSVWLANLLDEYPYPSWSSNGRREVSPVGAEGLPELDGVEVVKTAGEGQWIDRPGTPALGHAHGTTVSVARRGKGTIVAFADPSPVQNRLLDEADNAKLALEIVGEPGRPVVFVESVHGYVETPGEGLGAIPENWLLAAAGLVAAVVVYMIARGRRLGPPELAARPLPPPRREYVDSLGVALRRTKRPAEATESLRRFARAQIARRSGLAADASDDELEAAGRGLGIPDDELRAIVGAPRDDRELLAAGRGLARLMGGRL